MQKKMKQLLTPRQSFALQNFATPLEKGVTPPSQTNNLIGGVIPDSIFNEKIFKIVFSKPGKACKYIRAEIVRNGKKYQASMFTKTQVFHENIDFAGVHCLISGLLGNAENFSQYTAWDGVFEYSARVTKKGKLLTSRRKNPHPPAAGNFEGNSFNRQKNHIIREGMYIPVLADMGIFTNQMTVAAPMRDKFYQINRFLELLADETAEISPKTQVNIIDFGCGKSYLTFLIYHYFAEILKLPVNMCGLDLNPDIVNSCTQAAEKYGYDGLKFRVGDIGALTESPFESPTGPTGAGAFNIVVSLHACDTATDHALFNAVRWQADLICAVPCCQHELFRQMQPQRLKLFAGYGIIKERIASLATDAIRAKLLEIHGYKTQIIEFIPMEHTPKNLFIRARRVANPPVEARPASPKYPPERNAKRWEEIRQITQEFSFRPTLMQLFEQTQ
ncbi:MAG: SAM-dependent methyltransferase [Defluviitaleaceae bacterium]|nr:SAM-dependent methyltransferase [Defluviitaleaceae bacterium]